MQTASGKGLQVQICSHVSETLTVGNNFSLLHSEPVFLSTFFVVSVLSLLFLELVLLLYCWLFLGYLFYFIGMSVLLASMRVHSLHTVRAEFRRGN